MSRRQQTLFISLTVGITLALITLAATVYSQSYLRLSESLQDLFSSIKYYFCTLFSLDTEVSASVNNYSSVFAKSPSLPTDTAGYKADVLAYFTLLADKDNFTAWLSHAGTVLSECLKIAVVVLPFILLSFLLIKLVYSRPNTKHGTDTLPLRVFKRVTEYTYQPAKKQVLAYLDYLRAHKPILLLWLVITLANFNVLSVAIEAVAYYLYFAMSYDTSTLITQLSKLLTDLKAFFTYCPWYLFMPLVLILLDRFRKRIGLARLRHMENRNCGFINSLPIVSMTCGSMGKKKTTALTDMALSQEVMFREKALEILALNDSRFPYFPWICYEQELLACMKHGTVFNLATAKAWVEKKRERYSRHKDTRLQLYGYDIARYGEIYEDGLRTCSLFDVLSTYAQAYFIYVIESSLLVSNYSIREDNLLLSAGNFPMWDIDFFPKGYRTDSHHAHILDFDTLRLGKKLIEDNVHSGSFEFGVVVITEVGKERGNNLELKEVKKRTSTTNQKNDLFNTWLKMCRHSATVENYPFIKVFTDEQRPESWGADARDLADVIKIADSSPTRLAMPFFTLEEALYAWLSTRFTRLYYRFRYNRGDNTLLVHLLKSITSRIARHYTRIQNTYGYSVLHVETEHGTLDGRRKKRRYYLMNKKIYADRFSTDCFSDYFADKAKAARTGLQDYPEYATSKASVDELKQQNSYFISSLYQPVEDEPQGETYDVRRNKDIP